MKKGVKKAIVGTGIFAGVITAVAGVSALITKTLVFCTT